MFKFNTSSKHNTNNPTDKDLKEEGNRLFSYKQYEKAIECYNKAIIKNPVIPIYFTNRALCFLKLKQWDKACTDCRRALEMDFGFIKGCFFLGIALIELGSYDEAIKQLQRAHNLAKEKKVNYGDDITSQLRRARRLKWEKQEEVRQNQEIELLSYLTKLMDDDLARKVSEIKKPSGDENEMEDYDNDVMEIKNQSERYSAELHTIFSKNDDRRKKREVPDYLCGNISYDILRDPVITPSGITYDRKDLEEHLMVTTLAVYVYFVASLMGNQYLDPRKGYPTHPIDLVIPIFTFFQFFFYMGWLMVAETLVNPFGDDDDDFDVNWLIDRNLQVSYIIVDEMHQEYPMMIKDQYWNEIFPSKLPYTEETKHLQITPFLGSAQAIEAQTDYNEKKPTVTSCDKKMETKQKPKILTEVSNMMAMEYHKNAYRHDDYYNNFSNTIEEINREKHVNDFGESLVSLTEYSRSQLLPSTSTQPQYISRTTTFSVSSYSGDESDQEHQI